MRVSPLGQVMHPALFREWMVSHAAYPSPVVLDDRCRIFFISRDSEQRGLVGWCDVALDDPTRVLDICSAPVLSHGGVGAFDEHGMALGNTLWVEGEGLWIFYMGWNRGISVLFRNAIGAALDRSGEGNAFERQTIGPLLDRNVEDPFTLSYPFVRRLAGDRWEMLYGSQRSPTAEPMRHPLCRAFSEDRCVWRVEAEPLMELADDEIAHNHPWIIPGDDAAELLLFSIYADHYKLGLAEADGEGGWRRIDVKSLYQSLADEDWTGGELCYPAHARLNGRDYLFYCGKRLGSQGFGVASFER